MPSNSPIIREGADREGMQSPTSHTRGDCWEGGRLELRWEPCSSLADTSWWGCPIFPVVQREFVPLVGADREGKTSTQRPTHGTNGKSEDKGKRSKREVLLGTMYQLNRMWIWPGPRFMLWTCSARSLYRKWEKSIPEILVVNVPANAKTTQVQENLRKSWRGSSLIVKRNVQETWFKGNVIVY